MKNRDEAATSSFAKGLSVLELFKEGQITAQLDDVVKALGTSKATAYRYLGTLCDAGLLASLAGGVYVLGPKIIELDRLMRGSDPLLLASQEVMRELSAAHHLNLLLASFYRDSIMCTDIAWPDATIPTRFERGLPMSLFNGAMAKIILAHLSQYQLRNLALNQMDAIRAGGLGNDWSEFRAYMAQLAQQGYAVTRAEMMPGHGGVSAPIFDAERKVLGSITIVCTMATLESERLESLTQMVVEAAQQITANIAHNYALADSTGEQV